MKKVFDSKLRVSPPLHPQADQFGERLRTGVGSRIEPLGPISHRSIPIVDGGMFPLAEAMSPERFCAVYVSGASAYYDAAGLISIGRDVGVSADRPHRRAIDLLRGYLKTGG